MQPSNNCNGICYLCTFTLGREVNPADYASSGNFTLYAALWLLCRRFLFAGYSIHTSLYSRCRCAEEHNYVFYSPFVFSLHSRRVDFNVVQPFLTYLHALWIVYIYRKKEPRHNRSSDSDPVKIVTTTGPQTQILSKL